MNGQRKLILSICISLSISSFAFAQQADPNDQDDNTPVAEDNSGQGRSEAPQNGKAEEVSQLMAEIADHREVCPTIQDPSEQKKCNDELDALVKRLTALGG